MNQLKNTALTMFVLFAFAFLCYATYYLFDLHLVFGVKIGLLQWFGITVISNTMFPSRDFSSHIKNNKKNDNKGSKISRDLPSNGL